MKISHQPTWVGARQKTYPKLRDDVTADVAIIGGGLTGLLAAYLMSKHSKKVAVLEAGTLGSGATAYTTAFITQVIDTSLTDLTIPELVESGVSGFIARNVKEAAEMVKAVPALSRRRCRDYFERCSSAARMCDDYVQVYKRLLELKEEPALSTSDQVVSETELVPRYPTRL
jgi:aspartate oxidase